MKENLKNVIMLGLVVIMGVLFANNFKLRELAEVQQEVIDKQEEYINISDDLIEDLKQLKDRLDEIESLEIYSMEATAYTDDKQSQGKWVGQTATGVKSQIGIVAVDPKVIPLGTRLYVEGYGPARAMDTGGAIKGNRIDVFLPNRGKCIEWGRKNIRVRVVE